MTDHWTDRIVGDRMAVDQQFNDRVTSSQFSRQQWGLIMTAVEFDIENADDEANARLVADTSELGAVMAELENMEPQGPMAGMGGGSGGDRKKSKGGGFLSEITDKLLGGGKGGSGGGGFDENQVRAAKQLVQEYAEELQAHLEENGRWAEVRAAASADGSTD